MRWRGMAMPAQRTKWPGAANRATVIYLPLSPLWYDAARQRIRARAGISSEGVPDAEGESIRAYRPAGRARSCG